MSANREKILILGGTKEAAELALQLVDEGHDVTTSLAGRTKEAAPLAGNVRTGGFGGASGLADWMRKNEINQLVDATHPFALQISQNAAEASKITGISLTTHARPPWMPQAGDNWAVVDDINSAVQYIPAGARVLLALGSQHIQPFTARGDVHFIVRMVDQPATDLEFLNHTLVLGKPSSSSGQERSLLLTHECSHIVCRNSGGKGAYAKIEAARDLQLPVIMIERPKTR